MTSYTFTPFMDGSCNVQMRLWHQTASSLLGNTHSFNALAHVKVYNTYISLELAGSDEAGIAQIHACTRLGLSLAH